MTIRELSYRVKQLLRGEISVSDTLFFLEATYRHWLYYHHRKLIRKHILEQIEYRINMMDSRCYDTGSCIKCGCETIALQMAKKKCEGDCYPPMMNKLTWEKYISHVLVFTKDGYWRASYQDNTPLYYIETHTGYVQEHFTGIRNFKTKDGVHDSVPIQ